MKHTFEIEIPEGKRAEWINNVLTLVDEPKTDNRPVTERIRTFEDACNALGDEHTFVKEWRYSKRDYSKDIVAYLKLRIIAAALNEGWQPQFTDGEQGWFPLFALWTEEELKGRTEEWKKEHTLRLFGDSSNLGTYCGLAYVTSNDIWSFPNVSFSALIAVKSEELAVYFGKQFIDIWADYVLLGHN